MVFSEIITPRITAILIWLSLAAGALYVFIFEPGKSGFFPICPFRALTGFTCPGCGSTRGLHRLLHGDVIAAFELNPLFVLSIPFLIYALLRYTNLAMRRKPIPGNQLRANYIWAIFVVVLSFWIFRNTPFYPFAS